MHAAAGKEFDYDLVIIGCGVGGHGAALHAVESVSCLPMPPPWYPRCHSDDDGNVRSLTLACRCINRA